MKKELISNKQIWSISVLFLIEYSLVFGTNYFAKQDSWISILISIALTAPVIFVYTKILQYYPQKSIYDIFEIAFGKIIGKVATIVYTIFLIRLGYIITSFVSYFVKVVGLFGTPKLISLIFVHILVIYAVTMGIEVIGRYSEFFVLIIPSLIFIMVLLLIPKMNFENLKPILYYGYKPILKGAVTNVAFPFGELVVICGLGDSFKDTKSTTKVFLKALIFSGFIILLIAITSICVLGNEYLTSSYFPSYETIQKIEIGDFIQRIQVLATANFLISEFLKLVIIILAICKGIRRIFNLKDYRVTVLPVAILNIILSYIFYKNSIEATDFLNNVWVYYGILFQVILPLVVFIVIKLKKLFKSSS